VAASAHTQEEADLKASQIASVGKYIQDVGPSLKAKLSEEDFLKIMKKHSIF